jgi:hypothetical protein
MTKNTKQSSHGMASVAAKTLSGSNSSKTAKSLAASIIAQCRTSKQTGAELEETASKVMKSSKYNDETKSLAASVLSQSNKDRKN